MPTRQPACTAQEEASDAAYGDTCSQTREKTNTTGWKEGWQEAQEPEGAPGEDAAAGADGADGLDLG